MSNGSLGSTWKKVLTQKKWKSVSSLDQINLKNGVSNLKKKENENHHRINTYSN